MGEKKRIEEETKAKANSTNTWGRGTKATPEPETPKAKPRWGAASSKKDDPAPTSTAAPAQHNAAFDKMFDSAGPTPPPAAETSKAANNKPRAAATAATGPRPAQAQPSTLPRTYRRF